jgi:hypothetical protein
LLTELNKIFQDELEVDTQARKNFLNVSLILTNGGAGH